MNTSIFSVALFCSIYFIFIEAQGPYGAPVPNLGGGGYGAQPLPPPMMQGGGYGDPMEGYGQQLGAYSNHGMPHGYGPKPPPPPPPQPQGYGNPEMPPFMPPPPQPQQGYGNQNGFKMQQQGYGDNGFQQEGFGFEGFKESNDESISSTSKLSDTTASTTKSSHH